MGNTHGGGGGSFRSERVTSYEHASRPKQGGVPGTHHGTVVNTDKGNSYLIHSTLDSGVVATPASNMSKNWTKDAPTHVSGDKTVQSAMNAAGGRTLNHAVNYATSGTCGVSASKVESHLKESKK